MAFNLQVFAHVAGLIDNEEIDAGSLERAISLSVTGNVLKRREAIANGANSVLYSNELNGFNFLYAASDYDTRIRFTKTDGSTCDFELTGTGKSQKYGIPLMLGSDDTVNSNVTINAIQVFNESGSAAKVILIAVK